MPDPILIALTEQGLHPQVIALFTALYARAEQGVAEIAEDDVAAMLRVSPSRLRGYRSQLNASGLGHVALRRGMLTFTLPPHLRAHGDHSDHHAITFPAADEIGRAQGDQSDRSMITLPAADETGRAQGDQSDHHAITYPARPEILTTEAITTRANRAQDDHFDHPARANGADGGDYRGGRLVGSSTTTLGKDSLPTNQPPAPTTLSQLEPWEAALSVELLIAAGCENLPAVRAVARQYPFREIRAHALAWQRDTRAQGPGGLLHRIRSEDFAVPVLTASDLESAFFLRFPTPAEAADIRRRQAEAETLRRERDAAAQRRQAEHAAAVAAAGLDIEQVWANALALLRNELPAPTYDRWLSGSQAQALEGDTLVVRAASQPAQAWLSARLRPHLHRVLAHCAARPLDVRIICPADDP